MKINQLNKDGKRYGYWERYFADGELIYKGNYEDGKRTEYWEYYSYSRFVKVFHI